jgi:hypothetical protein
LIRRLLLGLLALAGCGGNSSEIALPLADGQVTVLFFYTDN